MSWQTTTTCSATGVIPGHLICYALLFYRKDPKMGHQLCHQQSGPISKWIEAVVLAGRPTAPSFQYTMLHQLTRHTVTAILLIVICIHRTLHLASFPGLPRFFCSSVSVDNNTRMRKGGEKRPSAYCQQKPKNRKNGVGLGTRLHYTTTAILLIVICIHRTLHQDCYFTDCDLHTLYTTL